MFSCRFKSITKQFFRKADGVVLTYDITLHDSFKSVRPWLVSIHEAVGGPVPIMLLGNKSDRESMRQVATGEGEKLAKVRHKTLKLQTQSNFARFMPTTEIFVSNVIISSPCLTGSMFVILRVQCLYRLQCARGHGTPSQVQMNSNTLSHVTLSIIALLNSLSGYNPRQHIINFGMVKIALLLLDSFSSTTPSVLFPNN